MTWQEMVENIYQIKLSRYNNPDKELQQILYIEACREAGYSAYTMGMVQDDI